MLSLCKAMRLMPVLVDDLVLRVCELPSQLLRFLLIMCELVSQFFVGICRVLHHGLGLLRALPNEIAGLACIFCHACFELVDAAASAVQLHSKVVALRRDQLCRFIGSGQHILEQCGRGPDGDTL